MKTKRSVNIRPIKGGAVTFDDWIKAFWEHAFKADIYPGFKTVPPKMTPDWIRDAIKQCGFIFFESFGRTPSMQEREKILAHLVTIRPDAREILSKPVPGRLKPS